MGSEILLADANEAVVQALGNFIQELGHSVRISRDGKEAVRLLEENEFKLAIIDYEIPHLSCKELFQQMTKHQKATEIIVMVSVESAPMARDLPKQGIFDYIVKPFDERTLERSIVAALHKQEQIAGKNALIRQFVRKTERLEHLVIEQEKRVAELESAQLQAKHILDHHTSLTQKVEKLSSDLEQKDGEIAELRNQRDKRYLAKEGRLARMEEAAVVIYPSPFFALADKLFFLLAVLLLCAGLANNRLIKLPTSLNTVFVAQSFLLTVFFMAGALLVKLYSLLGSLEAGLEAQADQEQPVKPPIWERALKCIMGGTMVVSVLFAGLAVYQVRQAVCPEGNPPPELLRRAVLIDYLESSVHRETATVAIIVALVFLLSSALAATLLVNINYLRSLREHAQRSSAKKRLDSALRS